MDAPVSEMEMCPRLPFPEWTPEDIKKNQLARGRKMLLEYEIKNDCIPGKKLRKKTGGSHDNAAVHGRRLRKRRHRAQNEPKTSTSSDCDSLGGVTASTGNTFQLSKKLNGLIFEVEVHKKRTKSLQQLQDSLNHLQKFLLGFQQYLVTYEQMVSEMEQLHQQSLLQKELLDQLLKTKDQDMMKLEKIKKELKETLELQNTISLENEQLRAQINAVLIDKTSREVKAVEVAMVAELLKEEMELEENQSNWSLTGNPDSSEESIEMTSRPLADMCSEQDEKSLILHQTPELWEEQDEKSLLLHQTPELWEEQQTEDPRTGSLNNQANQNDNNQNNQNDHLARKHGPALNWIPLSPLYPFFYRPNEPYPMQIFIV